MKYEYKNCMIQDCQKKELSKGLCNKHYQQLYKHGCILPNIIPVEDLPDEIWADIEDAEGFQVSNMGRVKSVDSQRHRILTPQVSKHSTMNKHFFLRVYLDRRRKRGWVKYLSLHVLVLKAFKEPALETQRTIFKDGDFRNCRVDNLDWFWNNPPIDHNNIEKLRGTAKTEIEKNTIAFIDGDESALDSFMNIHGKKIKRLLQNKFKGTCGDKIDEAAHMAFVRGTRNLKRGQMKTHEKMEAWFYVIARNYLYEMFKKDKKYISEWSTDLDDGRSFIDKLRVSNLKGEYVDIEGANSLQDYDWAS